MSATASRPRRPPAWIAAAILLSASSPTAAQAESVPDAAVHFFTQYDASGILARLDAMRPAPVSPAERQFVLASLPAEGEVSHLDAAQRGKLSAVRHVLELHGRESVYVVKVVQVPQAVVALHGRAVVLVSAPALDLLDAEELAALVAHEIGHEYFWNEYFEARQTNDRALLQRLELLCDGVAIITLRRAGSDPRQLTWALEKVRRYNRDRFGAALNEDHYPAIAERQALVRRLVEWLGPAGL
jgi:hypothetical protein